VPEVGRNLLTTFKVIVKKLLAYFLWTWCILLSFNVY